MANENVINSSQSDQRFFEEIAKILETVRKPFMILETDGRVLFINERFCKTFQISQEQMVGHPFFSTMDREWDIPELRHLVKVVLAENDSTEDDYEIDHIFPRFGHKRLRINGQRSCFKIFDRQVLLLSIEDYTKRKFQEQLLLESEARFRRVFETSSDGLLLAIKCDGTIIEVNAAFCRMMGRDRDELVGKSIVEAGIVGREYNLQLLLEKLTAKDSFAVDNVLVNFKSSLSFPAQVTFTDKSTVIQANIRDISERVQEKELLQKTASEWLSTFNAVPDLITIHDQDMHILRSNDAFKRFFSVIPEESDGQHCYEFFGGRHDPCPGCPATSTLQDHHPHTAVVTHAGLGKKFQVTSAPIIGESRDLFGLIHVARDITDLENLEQQLRQAQKMEAIGTLAGGIAHDFNNILTPILGYVEIALESTAPESPLKEDLKQVLAAACRAKDLVKQILTFSRKSEGELQPLKIQFILKETLKLLRSSIPANIQIRENIDPDCSAILADSTHIHQLLMNLCTNSYQAMCETGGVISISLAEIEMGPDDLINKFELAPGRHVLLEVSDSGPGISKELIDKIFEPYFTTKGKGTGLGLAVVYGIVKTYKGAITVYSEPGKGTAFRIYLAATAADSAEAAGDSGPYPRGKERILLVDDEVMIVSLMKKMLSGLGYSVSAFSSCEEALNAFKAHPESYDLIITDMTMPRITGDTLAAEILCVRPEVPVILCTGFSHMISKKKAEQIGIRKYLAKPVLKRDLALAVREVLDNR